MTQPLFPTVTSAETCQLAETIQIVSPCRRLLARLWCHPVILEPAQTENLARALFTRTLCMVISQVPLESPKHRMPHKATDSCSWIVMATFCSPSCSPNLCFHSTFSGLLFAVTGLIVHLKFGGGAGCNKLFCEPIAVIQNSKKICLVQWNMSVDIYSQTGYMAKIILIGFWYE